MKTKKGLAIFVALAIAFGATLVACTPNKPSGTGDDIQISFALPEYTVTQFDELLLEPSIVGSETPLTWSSSNPLVATVEGGLVVALTEGQTTITASIGDISGSCVVKVSASATLPAIAVEGISDGLTLGIGDYYDLLITATFGGEEIAPSIAYSGGSSSVATISSTGRITAVGKGDTSFVVTATWRGYTRNITVNVSVVANLFVELSDRDVSLKVVGTDAETKKTVTVVSVMENGTEVTSPAIAWSSSAEGVATVADGVITAQGIGSAVIKARYTSSVTDDYTEAFVNVTVSRVSVDLTNKTLVANLTADFGEATPSATMDLDLEGITEFERDDITDVLLGVTSVGNKNALNKAAFTYGTHTIVIQTATHNYSVTLRVLSSYLQKDINLFTVKSVIADEIGGRTGVISFSSSEGNTSMWANSSSLPDAEVPSLTEFDYILVDVYANEVVTIGSFIGKGESHKEYKLDENGNGGNALKLYNANGEMSGLGTGAWYTIAVKVAEAGYSGDYWFCLGLDVANVVKTIYLSNLRYVTDDVFMREVAPVQFTLDYSELTFGGDTDPITVGASVTDLNEVMVEPIITWQSSNTNVATVNSNGTVSKGTESGTATITATYRAKSGKDIVKTIEVVVDLTSIAINETATADLVWDILEATQSNYMPVRLQADSVITDAITDILFNGASVSNPANKTQVLKSAFTVGTHNIVVVTANNKFTLKLKVEVGYVQKDISIVKSYDTVVTTAVSGGIGGVTEGVVKVVSSTGKASVYENGVGFEDAMLPNASQYRYMLIDIYMENVSTIGIFMAQAPDTREFIINSKGEGYNATHGIGFRVYNANGELSPITAGAWFTMVVDLSKAPSGYWFLIGATTTGNTFYLSNIRANTPNAMLSAIKPVEFSLSQYNVLFGNGQAPVTITASVSDMLEDVDSAEVTWESDDTDVATVSNGTITAVDSGEATITATYIAKSGKTLTRTVTVTVNISAVILDEIAHADYSFDALEDDVAEYMPIYLPENTVIDDTDIIDIKYNDVSVANPADKSLLQVAKSAFTSIDTYTITIETNSNRYVLYLAVDISYKKVTAPATLTGSVSADATASDPEGIRTDVVKYTHTASGYGFNNRAVMSVLQTETDYSYFLVDLYVSSENGVTADNIYPLFWGNTVYIYGANGSKWVYKGGGETAKVPSESYGTLPLDEWLTVVFFASSGADTTSIGLSNTLGSFYLSNARVANRFMMIEDVKPVELAIGLDDGNINKSNKNITLTNGETNNTSQIKWEVHYKEVKDTTAVPTFTGYSDIIEVDANGLITAVNTGSTSITVSYAGASLTVNVIVISAGAVATDVVMQAEYLSSYTAEYLEVDIPTNEHFDMEDITGILCGSESLSFKIEESAFFIKRMPHGLYDIIVQTGDAVYEAELDITLTSDVSVDLDKLVSSSSSFNVTYLDDFEGRENVTKVELTSNVTRGYNDFNGGGAVDYLTLFDVDNVDTTNKKWLVFDMYLDGFDDSANLTLLYGCGSALYAHEWLNYMGPYKEASGFIYYQSFGFLDDGSYIYGEQDSPIKEQWVRVFIDIGAVQDGYGSSYPLNNKFYISMYQGYSGDAFYIANVNYIYA